MTRPAGGKPRYRWSRFDQWWTRVEPLKGPEWPFILNPRDRYGVQSTGPAEAIRRAPP